MSTASPDPSSDVGPPIQARPGEAPSAEAAITLAALHQAVAEALDRKRRLGQYAVFWEEGRAVEVAPEALPSNLELQRAAGH